MGLQRVLGMSYSTTWNLLQKLRRAMVRSGRESLIGTVEVDEAYIGGLSEGSPGRAKGDKSLVVLARELNGTAIGRIRMRQIPSSSGENLLGFIKDSVQNGTTVITDGWRGYSRLKSYGYPHIVKPSKADKTAMPHVHRVISLLKRWLLGTLQGAASQKYLDYYLDEYVFRFNRRKSKNRGKLFMRLIEQALVTPPITRVEIRQKKEVHEISSNVIEEVNLDSPIYYQ